MWVVSITSLVAAYLLLFVGACNRFLHEKFKKEEEESDALFMAVVVLVISTWLLGGAVIASPYLYLAGSPVNVFSLGFWVTSLLVPPVLAVVCVFYSLPSCGDGVAYLVYTLPSDESGNRWNRWPNLSSGFFPLLVCLLLSPILLNGLVLYFQWIGGYEVISGQIFHFRYWGLIILPVWLAAEIIIGKIFPQQPASSIQGSRFGSTDKTYKL